MRDADSLFTINKLQQEQVSKVSKQKVKDLLQELTKTFNLIPCDEEKK